MHKKLFLALAMSLASCNQTENKSNSEYQGKSYAQSVKTEIHNQYLGCYALEASAKLQCTNELAAKYLDKKWLHDEEYVNSFQYESEKLGFKHFINNLGLPCESISDGPKFETDKKAYVVLCKHNGKYLMQFNYNNKEWNLIKENNND